MGAAEGTVVGGRGKGSERAFSFPFGDSASPNRTAKHHPPHRPNHGAWWNQAVTALRDRFSSKCLCVEYGKFDTKLSPLHRLSLQRLCRAGPRARTFVPPRLRELRDLRGAHLPSPRWRARHGHPVASSFRHACLRSAPPCIICKRVASEAAASSRATVSLAERMHSTALVRRRCHPSLRIAHMSRSSPPATPHAQLTNCGGGTLPPWP